MNFPLNTVLIANRGEIAVRIARAARDLGIKSVAVYSEPDAGALFTQIADEAYALTGKTGAETYLNIPALLDVAARTGADCVHPGYGFLAESAEFARAVMDAGLTWVGPAPETIEMLGDKVAARRLAAEAGAPLAPGTPDPVGSWEEARDFADEHGLPIAIKAAFGGGGRGIKFVEKMEDIEDAFIAAGREAKEAFGRDECYVEKFLVRPRHVEVQVLADTHGHVATLGTRDCTTQRRFQKLIEECPAPFLTEEQLSAVTEGARGICRRAGYVGAGTVEYIVSEQGDVSFLEVNTRVQVEHTLSEAVTGVDIVAEMFRIAAGLPLSFHEDPEIRGHAFEFRINAEDPTLGFVPCPGTVTGFTVPTGPGIRVDAGVRAGSEIPGYYDSLMGKLIVWGPDRDTALIRSRAALDEFEITGVRSVLPFHRDMVVHPAFTGDSLDTYVDWVDHNYVPGAGNELVPLADVQAERISVTIEIDGKLHRVGLPAQFLQVSAPAPASGGVGPAGETPNVAGAVKASFNGTLIEWKVADGDTVSEGQPLGSIEAMKMESPIAAPSSGTVSLVAAQGQSVKQGEVIATIA